MKGGPWRRTFIRATRRVGWKIISALRDRDATLLPKLLSRLGSEETYDNKRHIVRALGNISDPQAETKLLELLESESGLILDDIANALGILGSRRAIHLLKGLRDHELEWVRQNVAFALKRLRVRG